jgi:hypothetical protein
MNENTSLPDDFLVIGSSSKLRQHTNILLLSLLLFIYLSISPLSLSPYSHFHGQFIVFDGSAAGEHGEGAKVGIAVLLRNECKVTCQTHQRQIWKFDLKLDPNTKTSASTYRGIFSFFMFPLCFCRINSNFLQDHRVLYCHKRNLAKDNPGFTSVTFTVKNILEEDFDVKKFLFFLPPEDISFILFFYFFCFSLPSTL